MVRGDGGVVSDVLRRLRGRCKEAGVNDVPAHACSVGVVGPVVGQGGLGEELALALRGRGQGPRGGATEVDGRLAGLKVVQIRRRLAVDLDTAGRAGYELSKLRLDLNARRGIGRDEGQAVQEAGEAGQVLLVLRVEAPDSVRNRLVPRVDFLRERAFGM